MRPLVTLVVPSYNYGRYVAQAVDSVLGQTLRQVEIIVIDDCSPDDTPAVLARYVGEPRVRLIRHERNQGHIRTYNEGLGIARGKYVGLLSADDFCLRPDALERQVEVFEANPRVGLVYTAHSVIMADGSASQCVPWPSDYIHDGLQEFRRLVWSNYVPASGTLLRSEVQNSLGGYDRRLPHSGDWDMWLRAAARHAVGYLATPMYAYRMHPQNMSHSKVSPAQATEELMLTLERAYAVLPAQAPAEVMADRAAVLQHALLQSAWVDLYHGRRQRAWQGAAYALHRQPRVLRGHEFRGLLARLLLPSCLASHRWYSVMAKARRWGRSAGRPAVEGGQG